MSKTTPNFKTIDTLKANYQLHYDSPTGFTDVDESFIFEIGQNDVNLQDYILPWDTAFGSGFIVTRNVQATSTRIKLVPLTIKAESMQQILLSDSTIFTTNNLGNMQYTNLPTAVDTTGSNASGTAVYKVSCPFVENPWLDSNSVSATHFGWAADNTLVNIHDGNNLNINLLLNRVPVPALVGERGI